MMFPLGDRAEQTEEEWEREHEGVTGWSYHFTQIHDDMELRALERIRDEVTAEGYRFVELYQLDKYYQGSPPHWQLDIEREEIHTPDSLGDRLESLRLLADRFVPDSMLIVSAAPVRIQGEPE